MLIKEAIKECCKQLEPGIVLTDNRGYWNINVKFVNSDGDEDETQFDVKPYNFDYGIGKCEELEELWRDFCKENGFKQNSVLGVYLINPIQTYPQFIRVSLYASPDDAAYASYYAALVSGNYMYGEVVLLKEINAWNREECDIPLNTPTFFAEWEWLPSELKGEEKAMVAELYEKYRQTCS